LLATLVLVLVVSLAGYWLGNRWLESSGGREMIEAELGRRAGMNVRLTGEFDLMFFPAIGVSGTGLAIGGAGPDSEFARSREYEISVALKPLLDRKLVVEWVRLTGGVIHPDRFSSAKNEAAGAAVGAALAANGNGKAGLIAAEAAPTAANGNGKAGLIAAEAAPTASNGNGETGSIAAEAAPTASNGNGETGSIAAEAAPTGANINGETGLIAAKAAPTGAPTGANSGFPEIQELTIRDLSIVLPGEAAERLKLKHFSIRNFAESRDTPFELEIDRLASVEGSFRWEYSRSLIHFGKLLLDLGGQRVDGQGCLDLRTPASLHLALQAGVFDLDAFRNSLPGATAIPGQGGPGGGPPIEIRARFSADELTVSGVRAESVVLSLGAEPACR
jgi:hypothetical protein